MLSSDGTAAHNAEVGDLLRPGSISLSGLSEKCLVGLRDGLSRERLPCSGDGFSACQHTAIGPRPCPRLSGESSGEQSTVSCAGCRVPQMTRLPRRLTSTNGSASSLYLQQTPLPICLQPRIPVHHPPAGVWICCFSRPEIRGAAPAPLGRGAPCPLFRCLPGGPVATAIDAYAIDTYLYICDRLNLAHAGGLGLGPTMPSPSSPAPQRPPVAARGQSRASDAAAD